MNPLQRLRDLMHQLCAPAAPVKPADDKDLMKKGPPPQQRPKPRSAWLR